MSHTTDSPPASTRTRQTTFAGLAVATVTLVLLAGIQTLRAFLPSVIWYLGDSLSVPFLVLTALAIFAAGLLSPLLRRVASSVTMFCLAALLLIGARLVLQFSTSAPVDLVASSIGVAAFMVALTALVNGLPAQPDEGSTAQNNQVSLLALSLGLAVLADTSLRVALGNYDLLWHRDVASSITVVAAGMVVATLIGVYWMRMWAATRRMTRPSSAYGAASIGLTLMAVLTATGNQQALAASGNPSASTIEGASLSLPGLSGIIAVVTVAVGLSVGVWGSAKPRRTARWFSITAGGVSIVFSGLLLAGVRLGGVALPILGVSLICALVLALRPLPAVGVPWPGVSWPRSVALFLGFFGFLALSLAALYDVTEAVPVAGLLVGVCTIVAALRLPQSAATAASGPVPVSDQVSGAVSAEVPSVVEGAVGSFGLAGRVVVASVTLVAVAFAGIGAIAYAPPSVPATSDRAPSGAILTSSEPAQLTVMTLNLHQGLDADTHVNLAGLIDLVRSQNPDVLALQEVNRGRANNGYNDVLAVLAAELQLPYLYGTNSPDGLYGNALLSRVPVSDWKYHHFEASSGERRGMLEATLAIGSTEDAPPTELTVFVTHLDHVSGEENVREEQLDELLTVWNGHSPAILLGDFNTIPAAPELTRLAENGWADALAQYGDPTATTFWGAADGSEAESRLDYIFVTPGVTVERVAAVDSRASDHKPLVARISVG